MEIILASSSPRRAQILKMLNIDFKILPSNIDEDTFSYLPPRQLVKKLSFEKANLVFNTIKKEKPNLNNIMVIGCDTIVTYNNLVFGKPKNKDDAFKTLSLLNNKSHTVLTGVSFVGIKDGTFINENFCSCSLVTFNKFSDKEIMDYVNTNDPLDKAGSYSIQGSGAFLIKEIKGDFYSITGLPLQLVYTFFKKYNII